VPCVGILISRGSVLSGPFASHWARRPWRRRPPVATVARSRCAARSNNISRCRPECISTTMSHGLLLARCGRSIIQRASIFSPVSICSRSTPSKGRSATDYRRRSAGVADGSIKLPTCDVVPCGNFAGQRIRHTRECPSKRHCGGTGRIVRVSPPRCRCSGRPVCCRPGRARLRQNQADPSSDLPTIAAGPPVAVVHVGRSRRQRPARRLERGTARCSTPRKNGSPALG
jgi:hypothetical protein